MMEFGFGSGILTGTRTDNVPPGVNTPIRFGALQDVALEFDGDIKMLHSLYQFPIDSARGKTKITGKAKVAQIYARMYNDLFFGDTLSTGGIKYAYNESTTLGAPTAATSYTVANSASTPLVDQGVFYVATGVQLTPVTASPGLGQYTFNAATGVYGFSTFDGSSGIFINYTYGVTTGYTISGFNQLMGNTPRFSATFFQQYEGNQTILNLTSCVSNRLTFPTRIDDYVIQDLDFEAFANTGGQVFNWYTAQ